MELLQIQLLTQTHSRCQYICYGVEGTEAGSTPHLQGYIEMSRSVMLGGMKKLPGLERAHFEQRLGTQTQAILYCTKEGDFHEFGIKKNDPTDNKIDWAETKKNIIKGNFDDIHPKIYINQYNTIKRIYSDNAKLPKDLDWIEPPNEWHYGITGTGKSYTARSQNPGFYYKMNNKWWENYAGETTVLIEDVGRSHDWMGDFLKIWADRYAFRAEVKNSQVVLRPEKIVVTSNYTPMQLWPDSGVHEPLERRFKIIHHTKVFIHPMFDKAYEKMRLFPTATSGENGYMHDDVDEQEDINKRFSGLTTTESSSD